MRPVLVAASLFAVFVALAPGAGRADENVRDLRFPAAPFAIGVLPRRDLLAVLQRAGEGVRDANAAAPPPSTIVFRRLGDGTPLRTPTTCDDPVGLFADTPADRIVVACRRELAVVDGRTLRRIARIPFANAGSIAAADDVLLAASDDGTFAELSARTGKLRRRFVLPSRFSAGGRAPQLAVLDERRARFLAVDREQDRAFEIGPHGVATTPIDFGVGRAPGRAAMLDGTAWVPLTHAGRIAAVVPGAIRPAREIATCAGVDRVFADTSRRLLVATCGRGIAVVDPTAQDGAVARVGDDEEREVCSRIFGLTCAAFYDARSGRLGVVGPGGVAVYSIVERRRSGFVPIPHGGFPIAFDGDAAAGVLCVGLARADGAVLTLDLRHVSPATLAADDRTGVRDSAPAIVELVGFPSPTPVRNEPHGSRSPGRLAVAPDGAVYVVDLASPKLGVLRDGIYRERDLDGLRPIAVAVSPNGTVRALAVDAQHVLSSVVLGPSGEIVHARAFLPMSDDDAALLGIVAADDGIWLASRATSSVRLVRDDGVVRRVRVADATDRYTIEALGPGPDGGVLVSEELSGEVFVVGRFGAVRRLRALDARTLGDRMTLARAGDGTLASATRGLVELLLPDGRRRRLFPCGLRPTTACAGFTQFAIGADGTVVGAMDDALIEVAPTGAVRRTALEPDARVGAIAAARDGSFFFTEPTHGRIGRLRTDGALDYVTP